MSSSTTTSPTRSCSTTADADVEVIYVGKKAAAHSMTQEQINALLVEQGHRRQARRPPEGRRPVRFRPRRRRVRSPRRRGDPVRSRPRHHRRPRRAGVCGHSRHASRLQLQLHLHHRSREGRGVQGRRGQDARTRRGASDLDWARDRQAAVPRVLHGREVAAADLREADRARHVARHARRHDSLGHARRSSAPSSARSRRSPQNVAEAKLGPPALTIIGKVVALRDR